jgi:hypothetical protein
VIAYGDGGAPLTASISLFGGCDRFVLNACPKHLSREFRAVACGASGCRDRGELGAVDVGGSSVRWAGMRRVKVEPVPGAAGGAGAGLVDAEEAFEDALLVFGVSLVFGVDAQAAVGDGNFDVAGVEPAADRDRRAGWGLGDRIVQQVGQRGHVEQAPHHPGDLPSIP